MNCKLLSLALLATTQFANIHAQGITYQTDANTGAISELGINNDTHKMNWVLSPDGAQYKWDNRSIWLGTGL